MHAVVSIKLVLLAIAVALLSACSSPPPGGCVPPQQFQAGVCVDTQGGDGGKGDDPQDPAGAPTIRRK